MGTPLVVLSEQPFPFSYRRYQIDTLIVLALQP